MAALRGVFAQLFQDEAVVHVQLSALQPIHDTPIDRLSAVIWMGSYTGNRPAPPALTEGRLQESAALLLSDRGG